MELSNLMLGNSNSEGVP